MNLSFMLDELNNDSLKKVEQLVQYLKKRDMTTTKLRNVFGQLRQFEAKEKAEPSKTLNNSNEFLLMGTRFKYIMDKERGTKEGDLKDFGKSLYALIQGVENKTEKFENMMHHMEALVALSKAELK